MAKSGIKLAELLSEEQRSRRMTDRAVATEMGVLQQTYSAWKAGRVPRETMRAPIAAFLKITVEDLDKMLMAESSSEKPALSAYAVARNYGRISDRKDGKFKFDNVRNRLPEGRYSLDVDTKVMEPALRVGCKVWLDPGIWPRVGDEVVVHAKGGVAWIGQLAEMGAVVRLTRPSGEPVVIENVAAVHVIVLAERV